MCPKTAMWYLVWLLPRNPTWSPLMSYAAVLKKLRVSSPLSDWLSVLNVVSHRQWRETTFLLRINAASLNSLQALHAKYGDHRDRFLRGCIHVSTRNGFSSGNRGASISPASIWSHAYFAPEPLLP